MVAASRGSRAPPHAGNTGASQPCTTSAGHWGIGGGLEVHESEEAALGRLHVREGEMSPGGLKAKWKKEGSKGLRKIKL